MKNGIDDSTGQIHYNLYRSGQNVVQCSDTNIPAIPMPYDLLSACDDFVEGSISS